VIPDLQQWRWNDDDDDSNDVIQNFVICRVPTRRDCCHLRMLGSQYLSQATCKDLGLQHDE